MAVLRKLSAKLRTAISPSPSSSPEPSPTARTGSSFGVIAGRKEGGGISVTVTRPEHHMRSDSLMTYATNSSKETVEEGDKKPRRMSRFREELDVEVWGH